MGQVLLVIVVIVVAVSMCSGPKTVSESGGYEAEAMTHCQILVEKSLKAPSTADFPWTMKANASSGQVYTINSYVDAQNSFGAMIRTNFYCQLKYTGDGKTDSWVVKVFKVLE